MSLRRVARTLWIASAAASLAACAGAPPARAAVPLVPGDLAIGVSHFEVVGPPGESVPDVANLLAQRLELGGVGRIVGPDALGASGDSDPPAESVRSWASAADVATLVFGRTTRLGRQVSVDVQLRSGETGEVLGAYVEEIRRPEELDTRIGALAGQVIGGTLALAGGGGPAPTPPEPAAPSAETPARRPLGVAGSSFAAFDSSQPVSITSDELEAVQENGKRVLEFIGNVVVSQADVTLRSEKLAAYYPHKSSQPERLVATGDVQLVQVEQRTRRTREARCTRATYDRVERRVVCEGDAVLTDRDDVVRGETIEFDLASEKVKVTGGVEILIEPREGALDPAVAGEETP